MVKRSNSFQNIPEVENAYATSYLAKVCFSCQNKVCWAPEFPLSLSEGCVILTSTSENILRQKQKLAGERKPTGPRHCPWMFVIN